jgi:HTH-type transcriptional regulator, quorum sensing regulator NprR
VPKVRSRVRRPAPVSETLKQLGERIRKARAEAGLSQAALGAPHFTRAYVSAIELGKVRPAMKSLEFMADKLGKPVSFFVEDEDAERRRREREFEIRGAEALLARPTASRALDVVERLIESASVPSERFRLHLIAGTALNLLVRGPEALTELTAAERLQDSAPTLRSQLRYQTALAFRHSGNSPRAIELLRLLLADLDRAPVRDQPLRLRVLKDLGMILIDSGDYEQANSYLLTALEWAQDIGDVSGLVSIYNGLAHAHRALGDLEVASAYLQKALAMNDAVQDLTATALMRNTLAVIAAERGHHKAALEHVDRAIEIARASGPAYNLPHFICTKAECEVKAGDLDAAEAHATEAMHAADAVKNKRASAAAALVLADVRIARGQHDQAGKRLQEAAAIYRGLGAKGELGDTYMRLSQLATKAGDTQSAQKFADLAFKSARKTTALVER